MSSGSLPAGVLLALRNARNRFFIPSKQNTFGGYQVPFVMLDTGCNTTLLPIVEASHLEDMFRLYDKKQYNWRISKGGGVAAVTAPVLNIEHKDGILIPAQIGTDFSSFSAGVRQLGFHLCKEDAQYLVTKMGGSTNFIVGEAILQKFVGDVQSIAAIGRRSHALLGQSIIGTKPLLQWDKISMVCPNMDTLKACIDRYDELLVLSGNKAIANFADDGKEFDDLEDEDHDGDAHRDEYYNACDE